MNQIVLRILPLVLLTVLSPAASAGERFASTIGTVQQELSADRATLTLRVSATDKTIEASTTKLAVLLGNLTAEIARLIYPSNVLTITSRSTAKASEWGDDRKKIDLGYTSSASVSLGLTGLENYGRLLTFLGVNEGYDIDAVSLGSSAEGEARRRITSAALVLARVKAGSLADEGGAKLGKLLEVTEEEVQPEPYGGVRLTRNSFNVDAVKGGYPIQIIIRVRAKFELVKK